MTGMNWSGLRLAALGGSFFLVTTAGSLRAQPWVDQIYCTVGGWQGVWFTSPQNGWVVGQGVLRTTDGQSWTSVSFPYAYLSDVTFRDAAVGLIVGEDGVIYRTTDGGDSWAPVASGTIAPLRAVAFGTGGRAYAAGFGIVLRSADDGATWSVADAGDIQYLDVVAKGPDRAWVVGAGGVIRATTTGGASWFSQTSGTANDLDGVFFLTPSMGWIAGTNATLRRTEDGGATWESRNSGISDGINAVYFVDANLGWAVGDLSAIYHTTNGGLDWITEMDPSNDPLFDVFFADADHGWAVGGVCNIVFRAGVPVAVEESPPAFSLRHQPNPAWRSTSIEFSLPLPGFVRLTIHDLRGRQVAVLVEEHRAAGTHRVNWRPVGLAAGVYFYRCNAVGSSITRKLVLLH